ncbi:MAG: multidrug effflux MFS transporter [Candidatus Accumulibacter sp.]|jgi:DHA1 family bicyclomycin/chloramphenicol resistance-like MFS transporter|nr:multidrug effflux MFS transporter [Accumulibacter sp.]
MSIAMERERKGTPPGIAILLAAMGALGPFSIDAYLPSLHAIAENLNATTLEVQQTLTAYLVPFAVMALWHGAISDALGRRKVTLFFLGIFGAASAACAFATRIETLWILRAVQGASAGAGIVISRAIVRDLFDGPQAQRLISSIAMMFAIAPALAPLIGGRLQVWYGWRSVFVFLVLMTCLLWLACWWLLPETLPMKSRQSLSLDYLAGAYRKVLTTPVFLLACGALTFNFAGLFLYIMSAPVFLIKHLGVSETEFLWLFGPSMLGLLTGSWLSGRYAGKLTQKQTILRGFCLMGVAVVFNIVLCVSRAPALPWNILPIPIYTLGMSLSMPSLTLLALDPFPDQRGMASSCQMFLQSIFNGLVSGVIAPMFWGSTRTLAFGMGGFLLLGTISGWMYYRVSGASRGAGGGKTENDG